MNYEPWDEAWFFSGASQVRSTALSMQLARSL